MRRRKLHGGKLHIQLKLSADNNMVRVLLVRIALIIITACTSCTSFSSTSMSPVPSTKDPSSVDTSQNWEAAKLSLRNPNCCVVSVDGLDHHLSILQQYFCNPDAPSDLDLRSRIRCGPESKDGNNNISAAFYDCYKIYESIMHPSPLKSHVDEFGEDSTENIPFKDPCILALEALAKGVATLADGPLDGTCTDVHMRIVFASNYEAKDPMFHTDKCPLRGYVTLTGPGTEYMERTCTPWEYVALRTLGKDDATNINGLNTAKELEFIVMKGDKYEPPLIEDSPTSPTQFLTKVWTRSSACIHRSPPAKDGSSKRRVILSLDLADGDDDQEWYEYDKKRGWRSGMTQRKSHLVA